MLTENGLVMGLTSQFERILRIWEAHCRADPVSVRGMLETEIFLMIKTVEMWADMPLDHDRRQMVSWFLQGLVAGLERNGNVIVKTTEVGDETQVQDCAALCRALLPRFNVDETPPA